MPKTLIAGTLYLITVESCSCPNMAEPFRLYATRAKADRFMNRLKLHHSRKPVEPSSEQGELAYDLWYKNLQAWNRKHPGGSDHRHRNLDAWAVLPMSVC